MPLTYEPIISTTLTTNSGSVDLTSIPGTYTDLRLVIVGQASTGTGNVRIRFNNDSGATYSSTRGTGNGSTVTAAGNSNTNQIIVGATSGITTQWSNYVIDIFNYAGSTHKTTLAMAAEDLNGSGNVTFGVGMWRNTAAITSIGISQSLSSFISGSIFTLYGIKKA